MVLDSTRCVHDRLEHVDEFSLPALVHGYTASRQLREALCLFDKVENPSVALWNFLISCCVPAYHGDGAFVLFVRILRSGMFPNSSTYVSVLNMCRFLGMLKPGNRHMGVL